jgi:hypothetical protein
VIELRYYRELSYGEIAKLMGRESAAIRQTHQRALANLRWRIIPRDQGHDRSAGGQGRHDRLSMRALAYPRCAWTSSFTPTRRAA